MSGRKREKNVSGKVYSTVPGFTSVGEVVRAWGTFVDQVAKGYDDSIYEYKNDLALRDILEGAMGGILDRRVSDQIRQEVTEIDERFNAATRMVAIALSANKSAHSCPWWYRVPLRPGQELQEDLQAEGIW